MFKSINKIMKFFCLTLILALGILSMSALAENKNNSANGQWQYVINRGDTHGIGGSMRNPTCPFYVGYFSLDFKKAKTYKDGFYMEKSDTGALVQNGAKYVMGSKSFEERGSYTPEDADELCKTPYTKTQGDRAPLSMSKISSNGRELEWNVDYLKGSNSANAIWAVKASYDGKDSMKGQLKAFICSGEKQQRKCKLLNTATFVAKRIKSIEEASGKPIFAKEASLTTWFHWIVQQLTPTQKTVSEGSSPISNSKEVIQGPKGLDKEFTKPSISAVFPAVARLIDQKCADGGCVCKGSGAGQYCGRCKFVGCPGKEGQPAPVTDADIMSHDTPAYCGNCGGGRCAYDGRTCL